MSDANLHPLTLNKSYIQDASKKIDTHQKSSKTSLSFFRSARFDADQLNKLHFHSKIALAATSRRRDWPSFSARPRTSSSGQEQAPPARRRLRPGQGRAGKHPSS
jgi:hypothetical protein